MSSLSITAPCIQPNPDISGIGVRVSIYAQAFFSIIRLFVFVMDGKITIEEGLAMSDIIMTTELTAFALLVSAVMQARIYGLSIYHANVVLVLSWITFLPCAAAIIIAPKFTSEFADGGTTEHGVGPRPKYNVTWKDGLGMLLIWIHYSTVAGLGIWVWSDVTSFGDQPQCTPQTFVMIFGHNILVTNKGVRIAALLLYGYFGSSAALIAFVAIFVLYFLRCRHHTPNRPESPLTPHQDTGSILNPSPKYLGWRWTLALLMVAGMEILLMASTEVLIKRSAERLLLPGESQWTFGQTLSVFLVFTSLVTMIEDLQRGYKNMRKKGREGGNIPRETRYSQRILNGGSLV